MELGVEITLKEHLAELQFPFKEVISINGEQLYKAHISNEHDLVYRNAFSPVMDLVITPDPLGLHVSQDCWVRLALKHQEVFWSKHKVKFPCI
jgi:hypothetical protein